MRKNVLFSDQEKRLKFEAENFKNFEITRTIYSSISYKSKKYKIQLLELYVDRPLLCCVIFYALGLFRICTVSESKEYNVKVYVVIHVNLQNYLYLFISADFAIKYLLMLIRGFQSNNTGSRIKNRS